MSSKTKVEDMPSLLQKMDFILKDYDKLKIGERQENQAILEPDPDAENIELQRIDDGDPIIIKEKEIVHGRKEDLLSAPR